VEIVDDMMDKSNVNQMYRRPSWNLQKYKDHFSIRISKKYRIELDIMFADKTKTLGTIAILESNAHYS